MKRLVMFGSLALLSFSVFGQARASGTPVNSTVRGADRKFAMMVAQTDLAEIQLGNLTLQRSTNDEVKKIAQKLVDDHMKTSAAMKQIACSR
jgi:putative membrane protein